MLLTGFGESKTMETVPYFTFSQVFLNECARSFIPQLITEMEMCLTVPEQGRQGKKPELQYNSASF